MRLTMRSFGVDVEFAIVGEVARGRYRADQWQEYENGISQNRYLMVLKRNLKFAGLAHLPIKQLHLQHECLISQPSLQPVFFVSHNISSFSPQPRVLGISWNIVSLWHPMHDRVW